MSFYIRAANFFKQSPAADDQTSVFSLNKYVKFKSGNFNSETIILGFVNSYLKEINVFSNQVPLGLMPRRRREH